MDGELALKIVSAIPTLVSRGARVTFQPSVYGIGGVACDVSGSDNYQGDISEDVSGQMVVVFAMLKPSSVEVETPPSVPKD